MQDYIYESKYAALKDIFNIEGYFDKWPSNKVSPNEYLSVISNITYSLSKELPLTAQSISVLHKKIMPEKSGTIKSCTYLLHKYGLKQCPSCEHIYDLDSFYTNKTKTTGKDSFCKLCFCKSVVPARRATEAKKRAELKSMTPSWANLDAIKHKYITCKKGNHIDHIIPLRGELVCGLHIESNLQEISAIDNITKSNSFDIDSFIGP
jgi:hypothetical protein